MSGKESQGSGVTTFESLKKYKVTIMVFFLGFLFGATFSCIMTYTIISSTNTPGIPVLNVPSITMNII